jgi:hypothetical protein
MTCSAAMLPDTNNGMRNEYVGWNSNNEGPEAYKPHKMIVA